MSGSGNLLQIAGVSLGFGTVVRSLGGGLGGDLLRFRVVPSSEVTHVFRLQERGGSPAIKFLSRAIRVLKHLKS